MQALVHSLIRCWLNALRVVSRQGLSRQIFNILTLFVKDLYLDQRFSMRYLERRVRTQLSWVPFVHIPLHRHLWVVAFITASLYHSVIVWWWLIINHLYPISVFSLSKKYAYHISRVKLPRIIFSFFACVLIKLRLIPDTIFSRFWSEWFIILLRIQGVVP